MGRVTETYRGVISDYVRTNKKKVVGERFCVANASIVFHAARTQIIFSISYCSSFFLGSPR